MLVHTFADERSSRLKLSIALVTRTIIEKFNIQILDFTFSDWASMIRRPDKITPDRMIRISKSFVFYFKTWKVFNETFKEFTVFDHRTSTLPCKLTVCKKAKETFYGFRLEMQTVELWLLYTQTASPPRRQWAASRWAIIQNKII